MSRATPIDPHLRTLVAIAHHGTKNRLFLDRMVAEFHGMRHAVDVVVLTEVYKPLPDGLEQRVGVPTDDPWSLPFGHRALFADRRHDYDLFVYAEDDTLITEDNLATFLELSDVLPADRLPGFMRYECFPDGRRSYCSVHSHYRWDPTSAFTARGLRFARFTNDHGACYALTRDQLHAAIESGGFLVEPHADEYDMLVTAATDVYVQCGFTKVTCLDRREGQLVHHLPNVYLGRLGVDRVGFDAMWSTVAAIASGDLPADELIETTTRMVDKRWARHCYPTASVDALEEVVPPASRILSVGTSSGRIEAALARAGHDVTAIPVDRVLGALAATAGDVEVWDPVLPGDERPPPFDVLLGLDVLAYLHRPAESWRRLVRLVRPGGTVVATVPNHRRHDLRHVLANRSGPTTTPRGMAIDGMHWTDAGVLRGWFEFAGLQGVAIRPRRATADSLLEPARVRDRALGNILLAVGTATGPPGDASPG